MLLAMFSSGAVVNIPLYLRKDKFGVRLILAGSQRLEKFEAAGIIS